MKSDGQADEILLIDYLLGRCEQVQASQVASRIELDEDFRRLHRDLQATFRAMDLLANHEPPQNLVEATLQRIRSAKQTDALLARAELQRRDVIRPTFSLRELAAVAGVLILLTAVFGVSFRHAQRQKELKQCFAQAGQIGSGLLTYANNNGGRLPAADDGRRRWLPTASQPAVSNSAALFKLVKSGYESPVAFQCPAVGGGSFAVRADMGDFPSGRFVSYSYQHSLGAGGLSIDDPALQSVRHSMAILADSTPLFSGGRFHREKVRSSVSENHDGLGQNVLYMDMHVEFKERASAGVKGNNIYLAEGVYEYQGEEAPTSNDDSFLLPAFSDRDEERAQR